MVQFHLGEDVKITITYTDDAGDPLDADALPKITIKLTNSVIINAVDMTWEETGKYYYWWDTSGQVRGLYNISIEAEFSAKTDIEETRIDVM